MRRALVLASLFTSVGCVLAGHTRTSTQPTDPLTRLRAEADTDVTRNTSVRIEKLALGSVAVGTDTFTATFVNETDSSIVVGVDLRTEPGMWIQGNWQEAHEVRLAARERRRVDIPYRLFRLTTQGTLRVRFGTPVSHGTYVVAEKPFFSKKYAIGAGNPHAVDPSKRFTHRSTAHLDLLALPGTAAERDLAQIGAEREAALGRIAAAIGVDFRARVRLVFYPDSATKRNETGHMGMGFANGTDIIEIYNEHDRLDAYHELTNIVAGKLGSPPAMLDEGFAIYMTEELGANAMTYVTEFGATADSASCAIIRAGEMIPLDTLLRLAEFGSRGGIGYPESGSIVKYLIEHAGLESFRTAYRSLQSSEREELQRENARQFAAIYHRAPSDLEAEWRRAIHCAG